MAKNSSQKTVIVKNPNGPDFEMNKEQFEKDIKHFQELSNNVSKYGLVKGLDPIYVQKAKEAKAAKILLISCAILFGISLLAILLMPHHSGK